MSTLICFSLSSTLRPRSVVASLALHELESGSPVAVLDVSRFSYVRQDLPPSWFARLCGQTVHHSALEEFFSQRGVPAAPLSVGEPSRDLPDHVEREFQDAVRSELVTYVRSDSPNEKSLFVRTSAKRMADAARPAYWALRNYLANNRPQKILIPNGRVAHQRLLLLAAQDSGVPVEYYEIGRAMPLTYYRGPYQVHDRVGTQSYVIESTAHLSDEDCEILAQEWLDTRMAEGSPTNPYSSRWDSAGESVKPGSQRQRAVFFSSSVDEFASYGESWMQHEWRDQFEAFGAILRKLDPTVVDCVLRIHPNLINKGQSYIRRELHSVELLQKEFPHLTIYWHTDSMSSYSLLSSADMVFVGRSTLGLEGSCLGKSVWTTTAARYDKVADVKKLLSARDLGESDLQPWTVDASLAHRFVASWVIQDHPLVVGERHWSSFDSARAPLCIRFGTLLVQNSLLHRLHLIRLEITSRANVLLGQWMERRGHDRAHKTKP